MKDRFRVLRRLGAGGMGVVYEVHDREEDAIVALKSLPAVEPRALYLFKQEFRSFANITHPNLVALYELFADDDSWFFTMERVDGVDFLEAVRPPSTDPTPGSAAPTERPEMLATQTVLTGETAFIGEGRRGAFDPDRLRACVRQLAEGLDAIHQAGKLHRDIKPSNVLVTREGRVVILDFGLIAEMRDFTSGSRASGIAGTIAYMSPEQGAGLALTPASDWYSVGVMVYEAMTGRLPFSGRARDVLSAKLSKPAPPVQQLLPEAPPDLAELCARLLERNPALRPDAAAILDRIEAQSPARPVRMRRKDVFVGRTELIARMREGMARLPAMLLVHGQSGVGKSALVEQFLNELGGRGVLALRGRCYEQESVPFRALDGVIDALSRVLMEREQCAEVLPRNAGALARAFPVLRRVGAFAEAARATLPDDPIEQRRQAAGALRELLANLSRSSPVVIAIDDLQWGDADSASLIAELMRPPYAPPLLLVLAYRRGAESSSGCVRTVLEFAKQSGVLYQEIPVEPLSREESQLLAAQLLGSGAEVDAVACESGGNPFFIRELAESACGGITLEGAASLDDILWQRVSRIPDEARQLLEVIAVAGHRLVQLDACRAAGFSGIHPGSARLLRNGNLIRASGPGRLDEVEPFHDRVRESIVARLDPARKKHVHEQLAITLEQAGRGQPETLAQHFEAGGQTAKAADYYVKGADQAAAATAFDHAVSLYQRALALAPASAESSPWRVRLGDALANAGRGEAAARTYSEAATAVSPEVAHELERKAAYHYCASGHVDLGKRLFEQVLARHGLKMPKSYFQMALKMAADRLSAPLRPLRRRERSLAEIPPADLERIDAAMAAGAGLIMVDQPLAFTFVSTAFRMALAAGDPLRLLRAIVFYLPMHWAIDRPGRGYSKRLMDLADEVAARLNTPEAKAIILMARSSCALMHGRWGDVYSHGVEAERLFAEECTGFNWELDTVRSLILYGLGSSGGFRELGERCAKLLQEAQDRGNLYLVTNIGTFDLPLVLLSRDQPEEARRTARDYRSRWTSQGYNLQQVMAVQALVWTDLYEGCGERAWRTANAEWREFRRHHMNYIPQLRIYWTNMRAQAALCLAAINPAERPALLRSAAADARRLEREFYGWSGALALLLRAAISALEGNQEQAAQILDEAQRRLDEAGMQAVSAAAKWRLARLVGGGRGAELRHQAEGWALREAVRNEAGMMRLFAPGFPE